MSQIFTNSLAVIAAAFLAVSSIGTITSVPTAQLQSGNSSIFIAELA